MPPERLTAEQIASMTAAELRAYAATISAWRQSQLAANPEMSAEEHDEWTQWGVYRSQILSLAADLDDAAAAEAQAQATARLQDQLAADDPATNDPADPPADPADPPADPAVDDDPAPPTSLGASHQLPAVPAASGGWTSTGAYGSVAADQPYGSTMEIADAVRDAMRLRSTSNEDKVTIATMRGRFADWQQLSGTDLVLDAARLSDPEEIRAAFMTPFNAVYELACANVGRRPVFNGLPTYTVNTDRGGVRIPVSPTLADITSGFGQWTSSDDWNPASIKSCAVIKPTTWNSFEWYSTYRCLQVPNMVEMTFRELVDAYQNRLFALWARFAETLLLEQMGAASDTIQVEPSGYSANVSLQRTILRYLALYQEQERWDVGVMDAWMPRWLLWALRMDIASRRKDGSGRVPSIAEVEATFRDVGVEPHWYMDRPTWATPVSRLAVSGNLGHFPSDVQILIHRRGKFAVIDKGELNLGLGGNPIRIESDVRKNRHTYFVESFEGLVDTDSCPAHLLDINGLCYNGVQIADAQIECEGYNMVGVGSA